MIGIPRLPKILSDIIYTRIFIFIKTRYNASVKQSSMNNDSCLSLFFIAGNSFTGFYSSVKSTFTYIYITFNCVSSSLGNFGMKVLLKFKSMEHEKMCCYCSRAVVLFYFICMKFWLLFRIGPLQLAVTWCKIRHAGEQAVHWDIQNKATSSRQICIFFVLDVPVCSLFFSMADFVPCDR